MPSSDSLYLWSGAEALVRVSLRGGKLGLGLERVGPGTRGKRGEGAGNSAIGHPDRIRSLLQNWVFIRRTNTVHYKTH